MAMKRVLVSPVSDMSKICVRWNRENSKECCKVHIQEMQKFVVRKLTCQLNHVLHKTAPQVSWAMVYLYWLYCQKFAAIDDNILNYNSEKSNSIEKISTPVLCYVHRKVYEEVILMQNGFELKFLNRLRFYFLANL